jgi:ribosomal-protein-alanine N-acetyltransferase
MWKSVNRAVEIVSERFLLRELTEEDVNERYLGWLGDAEAKKFITFAAKTKSLSDLNQYVRDRIDRDDILFLGIFEKTTGLHIGNIKYEPVNSDLGYAIMGLLIGDANYYGKSVAAEVLVASAQWLKAYRNINQIGLGVGIDNHRAIRAYEKVGFVKTDTDFIQHVLPGAITMVWKLSDIREFNTNTTDLREEL